MRSSPIDDRETVGMSDQVAAAEDQIRAWTSGDADGAVLPCLQ